jgi:hypothetical protein
LTFAALSWAGSPRDRSGTDVAFCALMRATITTAAGVAGAILLACSSGEESPSGAAPPPMPVLHLHVSNQSPNIDPVDVDVRIDGVSFVQEELPFADGHTWRRVATPLAPGTHTLEARSVRGAATFAHVFEVKDGADVHGLLGYWYYTDEELYGPVDRQFRWQTRSTAPSFASRAPP